MTHASLSDNGAQQRIVSDFQTTFLLEAGAGTGKTQLLLSRLLALLRTGRSPLSRIAVITFTDKAAAELRTRLRTAVESALQTSLPEAERAALQSVLSELDRAMVMTIHAFCAALLRERALEVGLDPAFTVLNQAQARLLHDQVWHTWLTQELQPGQDSSDLLRQAFRVGLSVTHLKSLCDFLVEQRDCLDWRPAAVDADIPTYCAEVRQAVARLADLRDCCHDTTDTVLEHITSLTDIVPTAPYQDNTEDWEYFLSHRLTVQPRKGRQTNWQPTAALAEARTLLTQIKALHLKAQAAMLHNLTVGLAGWLGGYLRAYQATKQQQGSLDFLDLLVLMRDGLKHNRELRRYFQRRFDFLLVDEVQDTDPLQAEMLFFLAEDQPRTEDWTQVALRAGKLFLVGDPQQSIYRFRRADLEVYHLLRSAVEQQGRVLSLSTNFRMRAALVGWMNNTFSRVLDNADDPDQPAYLPLRPVDRDEHGPQAGPTVFLLDLPYTAPHEQTNQDTPRNIEARCTAQFIRHSVEQQTLATQAGRPLRYGDIALLCRTNRSVELYERALQDAGVPYRSKRGNVSSKQTSVRDTSPLSGMQRIAASQERTDMQACVRTLVHPADTTALVATLRSSLFGFSDEELVQLRCAGGTFDYLSGKVPEQLPCADRLHAAFAVLRALHQRLSHTMQSAQSAGAGLAALLTEIYAHTPLLPLFACHPHGQQRLHNLLHRAETLRGLPGQYGTAQDFSPDFFDQMLTSALDESEDGQAEQVSVLDEPQNDLHILTIHKAKGLEFPLVIMAESGVPPNRLTRPGLVSRKDARLELRLGPRALQCCTLGWQEAEARERQQEAAEERRLWYVAATRAREYVVFPLPSPSETKKKDSVLHTVLRDLSAHVPHPAQHQVRMDASQLDRPSPLPELASSQKELPEEESPAKEATAERDSVSSSVSTDAQPSDIDWVTDRRRLIAKGRRKRHTRKILRQGNISQRQVQLDRLITQTTIHLRQERAEEASLQATSATLDNNSHASGDPFPDDMRQYIARVPLWPRIHIAPTCIADEEFTLHTGNTLLTGRIPLAFLEDGKWFIADFSLGRANLSGKESDIAYARLGPSALALEQLTPFPVQDLLLFLVDRQQEICVAWESPGKDTFQKQLLGRAVL